MRAGTVLGLPLALACALPIAPPYAAAGVSLADPSVRSAIVAAVEKERKVYGGQTPVPGVLIGVWDGSGGSYVHSFGSANLATRRPMSAQDHFRIGSNTKTFVISVLLQLVDEGKLNLDDKLSKFPIGVTVPNAENITVRELCQMRSGLFEAYDAPEFDQLHLTPNMQFDPRTAIRWAVKQNPYFAPGTGYRYSNTNYLLLGLIIESVTKDSMGNEIRKRLLKPFHLTETSYPDTEAMPDPWTHGYGFDEDHGWKDVSGTIPVSIMGAAGAMVSAVEDMKRWVRLYVEGKTNSPATQKARLDCIPTGEGVSFGLGIGCNSGWYGYTGGLPGYNTAGFYFPAGHVTIIAWVNVQNDNPRPGVANAIFRDIAKIMTPANAPWQHIHPSEQNKTPIEPGVEQ